MLSLVVGLMGCCCGGRKKGGKKSLNIPHASLYTYSKLSKRSVREEIASRDGDEMAQWRMAPSGFL